MSPLLSDNLLAITSWLVAALCLVGGLLAFYRVSRRAARAPEVWATVPGFIGFSIAMLGIGIFLARAFAPAGLPWWQVMAGLFLSILFGYGWLYAVVRITKGRR
jgi:hypothetical protein